jgi:2-isopropylmalate synthase
LTVIGATEHTTQTPPDFLEEIIKVQIKNGAKSFCIADTIGIARPVGTFRVVTFVKKILKKIGSGETLVEWHGHRDIGQSTANVMAAISAGADRIHLVAWGIGERAGNSSMETFLINAFQIMQESGYPPRWDLTRLFDLLEVYAQITGNQIPYCGCLGRSAFSTSLGIHTAAMLKARKMVKKAEKIGNRHVAEKLKKMARTVYSSIDPYMVGRDYQIGIGPWSGESTVKLWAMVKKRPIPSAAKIILVLNTAKRLRRLLTEKEIVSLLNGNS